MFHDFSHCTLASMNYKEVEEDKAVLECVHTNARPDSSILLTQVAEYDGQRKYIDECRPQQPAAYRPKEVQRRK